MAAVEGHGFARGALSFSGIVAIGAAIGVITTPFTTRMFDPATLGRINMFGAYLALMQVLSLVGLDQGYMRFYSDYATPAARLQLLRHCIARSVLVCSLGGVALWGFWQPISVGIAGVPRWDVVAMLFLAVLGSILFRYVQIWSRVSGRTMDFLWLTLAFAVLTKVSVVTAGIVNPDYVTGILFLGIGYVLVGVFAVAILRRREPMRQIGDIASGTAQRRSLLLYSLPFLLTGLLSLVSTSLVSVPVERVLGFEAVGVFAAGMSLASFVVVVQMGIQSYWAPYAYAVHRIGPEELRAAQQVVVLVICSVGLLAMAVSPILFLLLGPAFRQAAGFFGLLLAPPVLTLISEVGGIGLLLARRSWLYSSAQAVGAIVTVLGCVWLLPMSGLAGAGMAMTLGALATAIIRILLARASFRPFARPLRAVATCALFLAPVSLQALPTQPSGVSPEMWALVALLALALINRVEVVKIGMVGRREVGSILGRLRGRSS